jgi:hypothetical protein
MLKAKNMWQSGTSEAFVRRLIELLVEWMEGEGCKLETDK